MPKFMSSHTMPAGALKREQVDQMATAARSDPVVKPYRSFLNLAEGKVSCVMEAPSNDALAAWFSKMEMPCDYIMPVELEGERGGAKEACSGSLPSSTSPLGALTKKSVGSCLVLSAFKELRNKNAPLRNPNSRPAGHRCRGTIASARALSMRRSDSRAIEHQSRHVRR
jgi:Protein of unknown function (DUF4242)